MARLYDTAAWRRLRYQQLQKEPCCRYCAQVGIQRAAFVVDHIRPHRGDVKAFFDSANLQSLCKACHDSIKQAEEKGRAVARGCDARGLPVDVRHHWHALEQPYPAVGGIPTPTGGSKG